MASKPSFLHLLVKKINQAMVKFLLLGITTISRAPSITIINGNSNTSGVDKVFAATSLKLETIFKRVSRKLSKICKESVGCLTSNKHTIQAVIAAIKSQTTVILIDGVDITIISKS